MARRVFRFKVDLRKATSTPQEEPRLDPRLSLEHEWEKRLQRLLPARLPDFSFPDPLSAQELLMSYNASLERIRSTPPGSQVENNVQVEVFYDESGAKSLLSCHLHHSNRRISQVMVDQEGQLTRLSLEAQGAAEIDLRYFLQRGLADLDEAELAGLPGYVWTAVDFVRHGQELVVVEQLRKLYDPGQNRVRQWLQVLLDSEEVE